MQQQQQHFLSIPDAIFHAVSPCWCVIHHAEVAEQTHTRIITCSSTTQAQAQRFDRRAPPRRLAKTLQPTMGSYYNQ
jgi:hypothetical protein